MKCQIFFYIWISSVLSRFTFAKLRTTFAFVTKQLLPRSFWLPPSRKWKQTPRMWTYCTIHFAHILFSLQYKPSVTSFDRSSFIQLFVLYAYSFYFLCSRLNFILNKIYQTFSFINFSFNGKYFSYIFRLLQKRRHTSFIWY